MRINVEVVDEKIDALSLQVMNGKLVAYVPNKTCVNEVIYLIAALSGNGSKQELSTTSLSRTISVTCEAIDLSAVSEVVFRVEPQSDFVCAFGEDAVIDMSKSTFSFEPVWSTKN